METKKIIIADSQNLYQLGLKQVLRKYFKKPKIIELVSKQELYNCFNLLEINYLFIDPNNMIAIENNDIIRLNQTFPKCKIIITTSYNKCNDLIYRKEIYGYINKKNNVRIFFDALNNIDQNKRYICNTTLSKIIQNNPKENQISLAELTSREKEILKLIEQGKTSEQIASQLFISIHTFRTHRKNIMKKTKVHSTSQLIIQSLKQKTF